MAIAREYQEMPYSWWHEKKVKNSRHTFSKFWDIPAGTELTVHSQERHGVIVRFETHLIFMYYADLDLVEGE